MISSKKIQLVIIVMLTCIFLPVWSAEPNKSETELKFETSIETMRWEIAIGETEEGKPRLYANPGPVKPSYVAKILLHEDYPMRGSAPAVMNTILESPIAKKFSKEQQVFLKTELIARIDAPDRIPFYYSTWLYATSEEDAKLMVQAFIDGLNIMLNERIDKYIKEVSEFRQELDEAQKELPEKQKQLEDIEQSYQTIKKIHHQFSTDGEASDLARKSIVEMDKTLNALDIELAGIREKLKAIEKYRSEATLRDKLNEMYIELMIEMSGLEGRREITEQIRTREREFLGLYYKRTNLKSGINRINRTIDRNKELIDSYTKDLNERRNHPGLQPPKVYQDTVTIYPVLTDK